MLQKKTGWQQIQMVCRQYQIQRSIVLGWLRCNLLISNKKFIPCYTTDFSFEIDLNWWNCRHELYIQQQTLLIFTLHPSVISGDYIFCDPTFVGTIVLWYVCIPFVRSLVNWGYSLLFLFLSLLLYVVVSLDNASHSYCHIFMHIYYFDVLLL